MMTDTPLNKYIIDWFGLIPKEDSSNRFVLPKDKVKLYLSTAHNCFPNIPVTPDPILRPENSTTFFTTAGIQHIETILCKEGDLSERSFCIYQPCIRSRFADIVSEGISTSFVNFADVTVDANFEKFALLNEKMLQKLLEQGFSLEELELEFDSTCDKWGGREFKKTYLNFLINGEEVSEGVYLHDYPVDEKKKVDIAEVCFGVERMEYMSGKRNRYFQEHQLLYNLGLNDYKLTKAIDYIRTATLITASGILPAHSNPGRVSRLLIKKFANLNKDLNLDPNRIVGDAYHYWECMKAVPVISLPETEAILNKEINRSYNIKLLEQFKIDSGISVKNTDINLPNLQLSEQLEKMKLYNNIKSVNLNGDNIPSI